MPYEKSLPFFNVLLKSPADLKMKILQTFPQYAVNDLLEIIINVVRGNVKLSTAKRMKLHEHKKSLLSLVNTKNKRKMKKVLYKQKGGFIGTLLPIIVSAIAGLISNL